MQKGKHSIKLNVQRRDAVQVYLKSNANKFDLFDNEEEEVQKSSFKLLPNFLTTQQFILQKSQQLSCNSLADAILSRIRI